MADSTEQGQTGTDQWDAWRGRIAAAKRRRDDLLETWRDNVDTRRGKTYRGSIDTSGHESAWSAGVVVNQDWPITKAKIANLYSQTPEVRLTPRSPAFEAAVPAFGKELNDTIGACSVGSTIEEVLSDVVNASGIGAVLISCDKRTQTIEVPKYDPVISSMTGSQEMVPVTKVVDLKYLVDRISPADLLIPSDFTGSNYNHARWLGHEGRKTWAQAQAEFKLTDEEKEDVLGTDKRHNGTTNTLNTDSLKFKDSEVVNYQQIFPWNHFYDKDETNFHALKRIVFIDGIEEPKVVEDYQVQQRQPDGRIVGVKLNPIQVLTLTYISDDALPPSDCSIARPAIDELEQSRNSMVQQRKHSLPFRWGDTNRISANMRAKIDEGTHQGFIWVNGPGDRAVGEVARASFPPENFEFDRIIKGDITETVQTGTNQNGGFASGERSAREAGIVEQHFQRRQGQEQDKVQRFFLSVAEVLAAHLALYGTFDLPDELGPQRQMLANEFTYSVRVDSTVRQNADERIEKLTKGLNLTAQSGYVNPKPIISEIWELLGVDPAKVVIDPQPKAPEPVKVSISKAEDVINPVMLATLMRTGQAPGPDDIAAAVKLLQAAVAGGVPIIPPEPSPDGPQGEVDHPKGTNQEWETSPRIERRADDGGA